MPIILTSNGLTSSPILQVFSKYHKQGFRDAAVIVTADPEYREKDRKAVETYAILEKIGFTTSFYDIEYSPINHLQKYDLLFFIGGNPFYLLDQIRKKKVEHILKEIHEAGRIISGSSAGCIVLGTTIVLVNEFDSQMNEDIGLVDFSGVNLTDINICPHYLQYIQKYEKFEERLRAIEKLMNMQFTRINDGEALLLANGQIEYIKDNL